MESSASCASSSYGSRGEGGSSSGGKGERRSRSREEGEGWRSRSCSNHDKREVFNEDEDDSNDDSKREEEKDNGLKRFGDEVGERLGRGAVGLAVGSVAQVLTRAMAVIIISSSTTYAY